MTPGFPLPSLQTLPNTPLGVDGPFRFRQFPLTVKDLQTFPRPSALAFAFLSPATWLGYASTPLPTLSFRFMSNPDECKVGTCHDSGSSPNPEGGGSRSSDCRAGRKGPESKLHFSVPGLHFLRSASSSLESRVPEEGSEEGPPFRASQSRGGRGCGQPFGC